MANLASFNIVIGYQKVRLVSRNSLSLSYNAGMQNNVDTIFGPVGLNEKNALLTADEVAAVGC